MHLFMLILHIEGKPIVLNFSKKKVKEKYQTGTCKKTKEKKNPIQKKKRVNEDKVKSEVSFVKFTIHPPPFYIYSPLS